MGTARLADRRFAFSCAACFFAALSYALASVPALPLLAHSRGASLAEIGFAVAAPIVVVALLGRFPLLTRLGSAPAIAVVGAGVAALISLTYPLLDSPWQILILRLVHGIALATMPFATISSADAIRDWQHGRSLAIPAVLAWAVAPVAGGLLADQVGLTAVFAAATCCGILCMVSAAVLLQVGSTPSEGPELAPASRSTAGPVALRLVFGGMEAFLPLYALDMGLAARHIGALFTLITTWAAVVAPLWSNLAVRTPAGALVAGLMCASVAVTIVGLAPVFVIQVFAMVLLGVAAAGIYAAQRPGMAFDGATGGKPPSLPLIERTAHALGPVAASFALPILGTAALFQVAGIVLAAAAVLVAIAAPGNALRTGRVPHGH